MRLPVPCSRTTRAHTLTLTLEGHSPLCQFTGTELSAQWGVWNSTLGPSVSLRHEGGGAFVVAPGCARASGFVVVGFFVALL